MRDLNLLFTFEAIWRERSVTLAADSMGVTQAAVSGSLKRLRAVYGDPLFTLVGKRMEPSPLALRLADRLLGALDAVRETEQTVSHFDAGVAHRTFHIRMRDVGEAVILPQAVARLSALAPHIQLRSLYASTPETFEGLALGKIDMAIGSLPSLERGFHRLKLYTNQYVCAMRRDHPLAGEELTEAQFEQCEHVLVEHTGSGHRDLERAMLQRGLRKRVKVRLPHFLSAPYFLVHSDLLWSTHAVLAQQMAQYFPLAVKPHPLRVAGVDTFLYWHDRFHRDPANQWLRRFLLETISRP